MLTIFNSSWRKLNLLKSLAYRNSGLNFHSLTRLYKAFIRSKFEYGAIIFTSLSKSLMYKVEVAQNSVLRTILGAFKATPTALLNWELNIEPMASRWHFLASKYVIKLDHKPLNIAHTSITKLVSDDINWKPRSKPACIDIIRSLRADDFELFSNSLPQIPLPLSVPSV